MEKRKVTVSIGGQVCSFYSDDPDEYLAALEQRANAVMKQTAGFSGSSACTNAILAVLLLTDRILRAEQKGHRKSSPKAAEEDAGQVSIWDLIDDRTPL